MKRMNSRSLRAGLALAPLVLLAACSSDDESNSNANVFVVGSSQFGVAAGTPLEVNNNWLAFLADEAASGGMILNGDTDALDQVAVAVEILSKAETNLGVAATDLAWLGSELYIVTDEASGDVDFSGVNGLTDLVLLHWNSTMMGGPVFIAALDRNSTKSIVVVGETLFFASDVAGSVAGESSLMAIDVAFPETPRVVMTTDAVGPLAPSLLGEDEGLIFAALNENTEGRDLNGDGNVDDSHVLALMDGTGLVDNTGYALLLRNTDLAIAGDLSPYRARSTGANDWLVGVLVDEAAQEANFNVFDGFVLPSSWQASTCVAGGQDSDTLDQVLHAIEFQLWNINPLVTPPINTGLAGTDRVLIVGNAIATICEESDENDCSLNGDPDADDRMLRWIRVNSAEGNGSSGGPLRQTTSMIALQRGLPGTARAVAVLDDRFVVQIDEDADSRNWDSNAGNDRELLGWVDPLGGSSAFTFDHNPGTAPGQVFYAVASWMSEQPGRTRLGVAFSERSNNVDLNGDGDTLDSMPTWADFTGSPTRLSFLGLFQACVANNAGITLSNGWGFYRFDEMANGFGDANGNGQTDDILLLRVNLSSGLFTNMGFLNTLARPSIEAEDDGVSAGAAFLFDETIGGTDLNGDGDAFDLVPRYFQLP